MDYAAVIAGGLRAERNRANLSQKDVADAIGANASTVSAWENRAGVSLEDAWKLANLYGISLDRLAGRDQVEAV